MPKVIATFLRVFAVRGDLAIFLNVDKSVDIKLTDFLAVCVFDLAWVIVLPSGVTVTPALGIAGMLLSLSSKGD